MSDLFALVAQQTLLSAGRLGRGERRVKIQKPRENRRLVSARGKSPLEDPSPFGEVAGVRPSPGAETPESNQPGGRKRIARRFIAAAGRRREVESRRDDTHQALRDQHPDGVLSSLRDFREADSDPSDKSPGYFRPFLWNYLHSPQPLPSPEEKRSSAHSAPLRTDLGYWTSDLRRRRLDHADAHDNQSVPFFPAHC